MKLPKEVDGMRFMEFLFTALEMSGNLTRETITRGGRETETHYIVSGEDPYYMSTASLAKVLKAYHDFLEVVK